MTQPPKDRPMAVISESWYQYKAWAKVSREEKQRQDRARRWTLILAHGAVQ